MSATVRRPRKRAAFIRWARPSSRRACAATRARAAASAGTSRWCATALASSATRAAGPVGAAEKTEKGTRVMKLWSSGELVALFEQAAADLAVAAYNRMLAQTAAIVTRVLAPATIDVSENASACYEREDKRHALWLCRRHQACAVE